MELYKNIKKLGFGLSRLPRKDGVIDIEQTKAMVDKFIAAGFTYFDTARAYDGSEDAMRRALVERYPRDSFQVATKLAAWVDCKTREDAIEQFYTSLEKTNAGYFDSYLLHNLGGTRTKAFDDFDIWGFVQEKKAEGLIRHVGFSFHSTSEELEEILVRHPEMEFVQLQINYADWEHHSIQSRRCYEVARKYDKPIVVMEPIKGGLLSSPSENVQNIFKNIAPDMSISSWAIRFAADLDGVMIVLSGMSNIEQMEDNISYMKDFDGLGDKERAAVEAAREELSKIRLIPCTTCDYCAKVCPNKIGISGSFTALNYLTQFNNLAVAKNHERLLVTQNNLRKAGECIKCGKCEEICPQHIPIRANLEKAAEAFA